jgi:hypothetical protein
VRHRIGAALFVASVLWLIPAVAAAQNSVIATSPAFNSKPWIVVSGGSTTMLGDCDQCENENYLHGGHARITAGASIKERTDLGAQVLWVPQTLTTGDKIKVIFVMGGAQFRPWKSKGFFLTAESGMAFLRNWLDVFEPQNPPIRSKAFALGIGAGWEWRTRTHFGLQISGSHDVAALGDLQTSITTAQNVVGNFWSVGAGIVIR